MSSQTKEVDNDLKWALGELQAEIEWFEGTDLEGHLVDAKCMDILVRRLAREAGYDLNGF